MLLHRRRRQLNTPQGPRWPWLLALAAGVLAVHAWLAGSVIESRLGDGAAERPRPRFQVSFVRKLAPAPPLVAVAARQRPPAPSPAPSPQPLRQLSSASPPAPPASVPAAPAAEPVDLSPEQPEPPLAAAAEPLTMPAVVEQPAFDWPPSTRLAYRLTGNARGPLEGVAQVEWLRSGTRYQVFLEASVGPSFAPLMSRRESSEGEITPEGLSPRRYQMEMKVLLREPRRALIVMDPDRVQLPARPGEPSGPNLPRPPGLQDAVSQFVHLTWLFTLQPALLTPGTTIELPLALPRRVEPWVYEVVGSEMLHTEAGTVEAVHVRPRRSASPGDYTAEMWVAPSLQNLPVRIVVRQDAETFIDLSLRRLPEQAEPAGRPR